MSVTARLNNCKIWVKWLFFLVLFLSYVYNGHIISERNEGHIGFIDTMELKVFFI